MYLGLRKLLKAFPIAVFIKRVILLQHRPKQCISGIYVYKRGQVEIKSTKLKGESK